MPVLLFTTVFGTDVQPRILVTAAFYSFLNNYNSQNSRHFTSASKRVEKEMCLETK